MGFSHIRLSYILILHQTTTNSRVSFAFLRCLISLFYIKPQQQKAVSEDSFVVLYPYSTSNHNYDNDGVPRINVVLYPYSTSNHNRRRTTSLPSQVVLYPYSTSNHNQTVMFQPTKALSYILILHQTTTNSWSIFCFSRCLISLFYIKPQLFAVHTPLARVVLYPYSTSNHNRACNNSCIDELSYILILHQTTTIVSTTIGLSSCLISLFYIKPQRNVIGYVKDLVVLYPYSTSNHNSFVLNMEIQHVVLYPYSTSNHNV